jgi:anthranilate phosphoribosyltransferase
MILRDLMRILGSARRDGRNLTSDEAFRAFEMICSGGQSEIQIGAFLIALRWKGVSVEEVTAFARAARAHATIPCRGMTELVCVCPPHDGIDNLPPLDVAAGLAAAGAGAHILIISDRCVPPKRGLTAASVLESLGLGMTWDPSEAEDWVSRARFAAVSASGLLPALMGLRRVRGEIGVRTPLSTVEKLIAPEGASILIGAQGGPVLGTAVEVLQSLGHPRAIAVQGGEGSVVPHLRKRTRGIEFTGTHQVPLSVEPGDFGLNCDSEPDLPMFGPPEDGYGTGDNPSLVQATGDITRAVLAGEHGPARNATLLAAALMLKVGGRVPTVADGVSAAAESIDSGAARSVVERLRQLA